MSLIAEAAGVEGGEELAFLYSLSDLGPTTLQPSGDRERRPGLLARPHRSEVALLARVTGRKNHRGPHGRGFGAQRRFLVPTRDFSTSGNGSYRHTEQR